MKLLIRTWIFVFLLLVAAIHCSSSAHGFVVVVNSDLTKSDIDAVRITVAREGQPAQTKDAPSPSFPLTLGVTADEGDRVQVRAAGLRGGVVVVENFANATVQEDDQRMLVLDLCRECREKTCPGAFVCVDASTCSAPGVDSSALPRWTDAPPATACQVKDRPRRESSQTNEPPPAPVSTPVDGGDGGANPTGPEASTCQCPEKTQCLPSGACQVTSPGACNDPIDVTLGGKYTGPSCGSFVVNSSCDDRNWTLMTFATKTLPTGKQLHGTVSTPSGKPIGFKVFAGGDCTEGFKLCSSAPSQDFVVESNQQFAIGQRGTVCEEYTLTLELR
ncbi:MAG: hypothetical protein U0270_14810 [Labilithrix sp.]